MNNTESKLRKEIVRIGQLMYQKGFLSASNGNISARLGSDRYLITPSGLHKGLLKLDDLLLVDGNGGAERANRLYAAPTWGTQPTSSR